MSKIKLFATSVALVMAFTVKAQVSVENNNAIKLGSGSIENQVSSNVDKSKFAQAAGVQMSSNNAGEGFIIENGIDESSGVYMDGDKLILWSAGDANLVNFCDEDMMTNGLGYTQAVVAYIDGDGNFYTSSDSTRKEQITPLSTSLPKIAKLRGVTYYYKKANGSTTQGNKNQNREKKCGFLAQEVEKVVPEAVSTNKAGLKFVNYEAIIPYLVEAMKEQQTEINALKEELSQIKQSLKK